MPYLITFEAVDAAGNILQTETVPADVEPLEKIGKTIYVLGQPIELAITFDPPMRPVVSS